MAAPEGLGRAAFFFFSSSFLWFFFFFEEEEDEDKIPGINVCKPRFFFQNKSARSQTLTRLIFLQNLPIFRDFYKILNSPWFPCFFSFFVLHNNSNSSHPKTGCVVWLLLTCAPVGVLHEADYHAVTLFTIASRVFASRFEPVANNMLYLWIFRDWSFLQMTIFSLMKDSSQTDIFWFFFFHFSFRRGGMDASWTWGLHRGVLWEANPNRKASLVSLRMFFRPLPAVKHLVVKAFYTDACCADQRPLMPKQSMTAICQSPLSNAATLGVGRP